jgi:arabinan endo-1,5-alpha-L-arabinosidase
MMRLSFLNRTLQSGCAVLLLLGGVIGVFASGVYINPLKGDIGVHDPVMAKDGPTYFVFYTGGLIQVKTSSDRITWKNTNNALKSTPAWFKQEVPDNSGNDIWAPDISFRNGKWWLYYAVSTFGKNTSAIGLATSPTLNNSVWTDQGMVIKSTANNDYNCIDPNAFTDTTGISWLVFGSWWTGIKMVQVSSVTGKPAASPAILSLATHATGIEAPFLLHWKGYYYLFVSWDKCCAGVNSTYKIVVGRATLVAGPYTDKSGKSMSSGGGVVLDTGDKVRKGPGHNGILIENDTAFCINHYYDATQNGISIQQIRPLYWVAGWPTFTKPTSTLSMAASPGAAASKRRTLFFLPPKQGGLRLPVEVKDERSVAVYSLNGKALFSGSGAAGRLPSNISSGIFFLTR